MPTTENRFKLTASMFNVHKNLVGSWKSPRDGGGIAHFSFFRRSEGCGTLRFFLGKNNFGKSHLSRFAFQKVTVRTYVVRTFLP